MKIRSVLVHNFRSIKETKIDLENYSLLVGENNAGKTNVITALRIFYEDNDIKFEENRDFPKFPTDDESWVEIEFLTTAEEQSTLKEGYKSKDNVLRVRRYLKSDQRLKSRQSNIYGYENGALSSNLFYGAKKISQAKLGKVIYIPDVSTTNEALKLSGPSPFRDMVNFVFKKVVSNSPTFQSLNVIIDKFNSDFMAESSEDGISLNALKDEINKNLGTWGVDFGMRVNQLQPQEVVKSLFSYYLVDKVLSKDVDINSLGQGLQRHLIYTLIKLSSEYVEKEEGAKVNFSPDFTLLLFEEPEAFLHPSQQVQLNISLNKLSSGMGQQVLISTHSPIFVSRNIDDLKSLLSVKKQDAMTTIFQLRSDDVAKLLDDNFSLFKAFSEILTEPNSKPSLKSKIEGRKLGQRKPDVEKKLEEEALKYFMWLDAERAASFFAKHVIICEGATEKVAFDYLMSNSLNDFVDRHIYVLDSMGKFNLHRYMNLFGMLGITHSVLYDRDNDEDVHKVVNDFIVSKKNGYTKTILTFDSDFENFLGIEQVSRKDLKPLNVLTKLKGSEVSSEKLNELLSMFDELCKH
jgi:predicted ATP-dependent endonuclease of OLD family